MKITKNIKFEEIEKLFISCYNYTRFGDIKYPPNLKELYISLLCCEIEDLKKLNLPITLEKIYIHTISTKNSEIMVEYNKDIETQIKIPFDCQLFNLDYYENPFEDKSYWISDIKEKKIIECNISNNIDYYIIKCIKHNDKYNIPVDFSKPIKIKNF